MGIVSTQLDPEKNSKEVISQDGKKLILMDGNEIELYPKEQKTDKVISGEIILDTTGEYLSVGSKPHIKDKSLEEEIERQYGHQIFYENIWFFLEYAKEILSDSRMFLAPVKVTNGIAYTGVSGFQHPTLGIYLEWWLNFSDASIDDNGNPVWYISGSPLSGRNCCKAASLKGECVDIKQRTKFLDIWTSFCKVNNRYNEVKLNFEAFSLEEVLIMLKGDNYLFRIQEMKFEIRDRLRKKEISSLNAIIERISKELSSNINKNKQLELKHNSNEIKAFISQYSDLQKEYEPIHSQYLKDYKELKRRFHSGTLEGDYHILLSEISREMRNKKNELSNMVNLFMHETFGKNPNRISFKEVLKFSKKNI